MGSGQISDILQFRLFCFDFRQWTDERQKVDKNRQTKGRQQAVKRQTKDGQKSDSRPTTDRQKAETDIILSDKTRGKTT